MFATFTERARAVMRLAERESHRRQHEHLGTEHILYTLVRERTSVGANVLTNLGVDLDAVKRELESRFAPPSVGAGGGRPSYTPRAKEAVATAIDEAAEFGHQYVGTEHLLLGLLAADGSASARVLGMAGVVIDEVREEIVNLLGLPDLSADDPTIVFGN